jgi:hypothetical protein
VLESVESVGWVDSEIPEWLLSVAQAGGADDDERFWNAVPTDLARESEIGGDTVRAVPFLLTLAARAPAGRAHIATLLAMVVSPEFETPVHTTAARAVLAGRLAELVALTDDADPGVRARAFQVLGYCGGPAATLRAAWDTETAPDARVAVILGLAAHEPELAEAVLLDGSPAERLAAAVGLRRAGRTFPNGAGAAVASAVAAGAELDALTVMLPFTELVADNSDARFVTDYLAEVLRPGHPGAEEAAYGLLGRCRRSRSAAEPSVPMLRPLLRAPDAQMRKAVYVVSRIGRAATAFADELAAMAATVPDLAGDVRRHPEYRALTTLVRLNDPRWIAPAGRAWAAGRELHLSTEFGYAPIGADLVAALVAALEQSPGERPAEVVALVGAVADLAAGYRSWTEQRTRLRPLEPALRAVAELAPGPVARALFDLGVARHRDLLVMTHLDLDPHGAAAVELFHRFDAVTPFVLALQRSAPHHPHRVAGLVRRLLAPRDDESGLWVRTLLARYSEDALGWLDNRSLVVRLAAAHLRLRVGDAQPARDHVPAGLQNEWTAAYAAGLAVQLRDPALEPLLRKALVTPTPERATVPAAEALVALGVPRAEVAEPLLRWLPDCDEPDEIVRVARTFLDPAVLRDLAASDARLDTHDIWRDERTHDAVRAAVRATDGADAIDPESSGVADTSDHESRPGKP